MLRRIAVLLCMASGLLAQWKVGRAQVDITPPVGTPMGGLPEGRLTPGMLDRLHVRAIVIEQGRERVALVAVEVFEIPRGMMKEIRSRIRQGSRIADVGVMVSATHTRMGPHVGGRVTGVSPESELLALEYYRSLPALIAESVEKAVLDLRPGRIWADGDGLRFNGLDGELRAAYDGARGIVFEGERQNSGVEVPVGMLVGSQAFVGPAEVQVLGFGREVAIVGLAGEVLEELATAVVKTSAFARTVVTAFANGNESLDSRKVALSAWRQLSELSSH